MKGWIGLVLSTAFLLSSCSKENVLFSESSDNKIVFSSSIAGLPQTRAQGTQWDSNDSIGIFMYQGGTTLSTSTIVNEGSNRSYITNGNGNFSPKTAAQALENPTGSKVNFVAYYPFQKLSNFIAQIDLSKQQNQPALDFMVANNTTASGQGAVALSFERQMSKLILTLKGTDLGGLKATFKALPTKSTYDLASGTLSASTDAQDVLGNVSTNASNEIQVEWTILPMTSTSGQKIVFTKADGSSYTWNLAANTSFLKGHRYQYDVTLGTGGTVEPIPTASYMELPVITTSSTLQYSLKMSSSKNRRNYAMLYDTEHKLAQWVAYPLTKDYLGGLSRSERWAYDPFYPQNLQANLSKGYPNNGALNIDRGHQIPSGDRTNDYNENVATFYYSNMTPQIKTLNQQVWAKLEDQVRSWATASGVDTMYVVTGGMVTTATDKTVDYVDDNSDRSVAKPKYYYKVLAMKRGTTYYTIGFRFNNVSTPSNANYMNYTKTVTEIEKETGFTFFPALSTAVKSTIDTRIWN